MPRWLFWTLLTLASWGIWAILSRLVEREISPAQSQAISTLGIVPVLVMLWLLPEPGHAGNRRRGILMALGSGIVSCLGNVAFYDVLTHGAKAAAIIPITALYPAVTVLLAIPLLKERLNRIQMLGICMSLAAIYLFNLPTGPDVVTVWLFWALVPVGLWGVCGLMQKMATNDISARSCAIWFLAAFVPVAVLILIFDPLTNPLSAQTLRLVAAVGFALALGNFTILLAYASDGKASIITPLAGLYPLVSIPIAIKVFDERVGAREWWGIGLALAAVIMLSYQSEPTAPAVSPLDLDTSR